MDTNTIIIVIAIFAAQSVPLALYLYIAKKIDDFKDEVSTRLSKIENKLDISDVQYHNTNEIVKSNNQTTNQRVDKLETDFKEFKADQKSLINKILDLSPKKPIL